jgi:hypothetical protein
MNGITARATTSVADLRDRGCRRFATQEELPKLLRDVIVTSLDKEHRVVRDTFNGAGALQFLRRDTGPVAVVDAVVSPLKEFLVAITKLAVDGLIPCLRAIGIAQGEIVVGRHPKQPDLRCWMLNPFIQFVAEEFMAFSEERVE